MKKLSVITVIILIPAIIAGIWCRRTFVDCNELKYYKIAPVATSVIAKASENLEGVINEAQHVLRVKCISAPLFTFKRMYQTVEVREVFEGEGITVGDTIKITPCSSCIFTADNSINMGFVNAMKKDKEYLVLLNKKEVVRELKLELYPTAQALIALIFAYEDTVNAPVGEVISVPYTKAQDNELFARTQEGLDIFLDIKQKVMERYR